MILADIKTYLRQRGQASLADLVLHFDSEPEALRGMLDLWVRKGRVRKVQLGGSCGGCSECDPMAGETYQWSGDDAVPVLGDRCQRVTRLVTDRLKPRPPMNAIAAGAPTSGALGGQ